MKILTVVGARPQFIKAAVVSRAIAENNKLNKSTKITEVIIHTGQHYDVNMSEVFFEEMRIPKPNYNLGVGGSSHGAMTGRMLEKIEEILLIEKPDIVLVYGDTNSTLAGALSAVKLHIPVAHVEAGLRSFNLKMPEEVNRILTDRIAHWLFCPTNVAVNNLHNEGFINNKHLNIAEKSLVYNVGDVMYDAALYYQKIAQPSDNIKKFIEEYSGCFYLATVHRAENTDDLSRLRNIISSLDKISSKTPVILPLHPRTKKIINENGPEIKNIKIIEPVGYFDMITLLSNCKAVFTDSGGVQKESYFFKKPCITLRDETEWVELVDYGFNTLVGAAKEKILEAESNIKNQNIDSSTQLYGDGNTGNKIVQLLIEGYYEHFTN